tara:strand:- start:3026 stop:3493 length:468 start_codon:yes stop_codon:yes gene_type:complete
LNKTSAKILENVCLADALSAQILVAGEIYAATGADDIGLLAAESEELTAILSDHFGGTVIYIPHDMKESAALVEVVGSRNATTITDILGGMRIYVPKLDTLRRQYRNREIRNLRESGEYISSIARRFNLSDRQVHNVLNLSESKNQTKNKGYQDA